ncbi:MAG: chromosome segregation protein SMC [Deltaproteobacteria bacterium]|nr:chromosome segregation protein SMC [Deltaproteobacteria bacterium]
MKIKKLSIHGFKSFPDRVQFTFPSGTSAVVGPNGCGKSNVVDAIRWVLGEQNARHLRGKLMEDLIFTGSDSRKPVGMAEVTLTLLNEEGKSPAAYANFTEIEILRRLYRSGESEYFINKVPSRLRDIVDLFTDTGIGTRAYSIIEQGQVGWLVTAKPEERRTLFEEAAGINKYRHKKEEALRKLESTRQNLLRVSDIIGEVKRQLNSLLRQAKKAERYKLLKDELREADLYLARLEWGRISEEKEELQKQLNALEDREITLSARMGEKEGEAGGLNVEYLRKEDDYKKLRERAYEAEKLIAEEERSIELVRLRGEELRKSAERLSFETEELVTRKAGLADEIEGLRTELGRLEKTLGEERARFDENESALVVLTNALKEKEALLREGETVSLQGSARLSDIRHSIQNCLREEELIRAKEAKLKGEEGELGRTLSEKKSSCAESTKVLEGILRKKAFRESEISNVGHVLDELAAERLHKEGPLEALKEELSSKRARLGALEEISADGAAVTLMEGHTTAGVYGFVSDFIETSPGYEKAVEAVLGERLNYVIVESQKQGMEAVEQLKKSGGRGGFIPVKESRALKTDDRAPEGTINLKDEITVKNGYGSIIKNLLEDVVVTDSFESAIEIWKRNGIQKTFVTTEGEMIDPRGIITGGHANGGGVLRKRKEIKELTSGIEDIEQRLYGLDEELKGMDSYTASSKALMESSRERLYKDDIERVNCEAGLKRAEEEIKELAARISSISTELLSAEKEENSVREKKLMLSGERESLEKDGEKRDELIKTLSLEVLSIKEKKEEKARLSTDVRVLLASLTERFEHLKNQLAEKQESVKEIEGKVRSKKEEIEGSGREIEAKKEEEKGHIKVLEELLLKKDALKKEETHGEEGLSSLSARIKSLEGECKALRADIEAVGEGKGELSLKLKEFVLSLGNLKEKAIERYGADISAGGGGSPPEMLLNLPLEVLNEKVKELREKIGMMGEVSLAALEEYKELEGRHNFLLEQQTDLTKSVETLQNAISRINRTTRERFQSTFDEVNRKFMETFPRFFNGGRAELKLVGEEDILESGIEIVAQPPGKKLQIISLLSGGEKALTATALIFSIFSIKPSPFCLLDEVDAPLDDANVDRFNGFVKEMSEISQFILITHNKRTMEMADTLFGITMEEPGVTKVVAVNL